MPICLCLSLETRSCRALADWPGSAGGRASRELPGRCWASQLMPNILLAAGAYRIGHTGRTDLFNPFESRGNYSATSNNMKLVHWPLNGWAVTFNGQCTNFILFDVAL